MKSSTPTLKIWTAICLILLAMLVPHHHHDDGQACVSLDWSLALDGEHPGVPFSANSEHHGHKNNHRHDEGHSGHCSLKMPVVKVMSQRNDATDTPMPALLPPIATTDLLPAPYFIWLEPACFFSDASVPVCLPGKHLPQRGPPFFVV